MTCALERHDQGEARVIPVLLRKVDGWQTAPFARLQALPIDLRPVTTWPNRDEAFADVARGIRQAVSQLAVSQPKSSSLPASQPAVLPASSPQRTPAMDPLTLVRTLTDLTPADFAALIAMIPGAARQLSRVSVPEQGGELIRWAESPRARPRGRRGGSHGAPKPLTGLPPLTGTPAAGQREDCPPPTGLQLAVYHAGHALQGAAGVPGRPAEDLVREDRRAVAVHGLGGVGKTRAAPEYAWRHDKDYTALLFVSAPTAAELRANLANRLARW